MMQEHSHFEELCAAANVGQISPGELQELQAHTEGCDFCKELQADFMEVSSVWLAQTQQLEPELYDQPSVLRKSILRNLQDAGANFSSAVETEIKQHPTKLGSFGFGSFRTPAAAWTIAGVLMASAAGFAIGSMRHFSSATIIASRPTPAAPVVQVAQPAPTPTIDTLRQRSDSKLQEELASSEAARSQLQNELNGLRQQVTSLQDARTRDDKALAQLQATADQRQEAFASAQSQLQALKDTQNAKNADLAVALSRVHDLEQKIGDQTAAQERDRQLAALSTSSEMRDVIASRNLHIIDVADVDRGGVRRPFGRVFYTEGKSLIFYAYDLSNGKSKQTFYAWGTREGNPHATRALGALSFDDETQKRWVFRFNDTKVLSQIDSVYVTVEPNDHPGEKPKGQKLLNAYLGTQANHP